MSVTMDDNIKRWTAKRKTALVVEIIQGKTTVAEASRAAANAGGQIYNQSRFTFATLPAQVSGRTLPLRLNLLQCSCPFWIAAYDQGCAQHHS
jgi:hypothetical protein